MISFYHVRWDETTTEYRSLITATMSIDSIRMCSFEMKPYITVFTKRSGRHCARLHIPFRLPFYLHLFIKYIILMRLIFLNFVLSNIAENQVLMAREGGIEALIDLLDSEHDLIQRFV